MTTKLVELLETDEQDQDVIAQVLERDNYQCRSCGDSGPNRLHAHHIRYRSRQGPTVKENLITLCWRCHRRWHDDPSAFLVTEVDGTMQLYVRRQSA